MENKGRRITINFNGTDVEINESMKRAWYKMINDTRRYAKKKQMCAQKNYMHCCGDCALCPWIVASPVEIHEAGFAGKLNSPDTLFNLEDLVDENPGPEELVEYADMLDHLFEHARSICKDGDLILTMIIEKLSTHEIARRLGITQSTAYYRINKVLNSVRRYYLEHFI